jgi:hypothetical protein
LAQWGDGWGSMWLLVVQLLLLLLLAQVALHNHFLRPCWIGHWAIADFSVMQSC